MTYLHTNIVAVWGVESGLSVVLDFIILLLNEQYGVTPKTRHPIERYIFDSPSRTPIPYKRLSGEAPDPIFKGLSRVTT